jgi:hypothetical protein
LPMITEGRLSINLVKNSSGMCGVMLLLLGCGGFGFGPPDAASFAKTWREEAGLTERPIV